MREAILRHQEGVLINFLTGLFGIVVILLGILIKCQPYGTLFLSVGASVLATAIVTYISSKYLLRRGMVSDLCEKWCIQRIHETRSEINVITTELLRKTDYLDIIAFGLKNFRDAKSDLIEEKIKRGMKLRILVPKPDAPFLANVDKRENLTEGATANDIGQLVQWVKKLGSQSREKDEQVAIKAYRDDLPLDFYFSLKGALFVGPYQDKSSQQTITYEYTDTALAFMVYQRYFDQKWKDGLPLVPRQS